MLLHPPEGRYGLILEERYMCNLNSAILVFVWLVVDHSLLENGQFYKLRLSFLKGFKETTKQFDYVYKLQIVTFITYILNKMKLHKKHVQEFANILKGLAEKTEVFQQMLNFSLFLLRTHRKLSLLFWVIYNELVFIIE